MTWIDDAIERGLGLLDGASAKDMRSYLDETTERMIQEGVPRPKKDLSKYKSRIIGIGPSGGMSIPGASDEDIRNDVETVIQRLLDWKNRVLDPMSIAGRNRVENNNVNINHNVVSADSSASSVSSSSVSAVIDLIDSDERLSEDEKAALQSLLIGAKNEARKKDSGAFAEIGAKALEGVKNATPQVVSGVLSFLASAAASAFGA